MILTLLVTIGGRNKCQIARLESRAMQDCNMKQPVFVVICHPNKLLKGSFLALFAK